MVDDGGNIRLDEHTGGSGFYRVAKGFPAKDAIWGYNCINTELVTRVVPGICRA